MVERITMELTQGEADKVWARRWHAALGEQSRHIARKRVGQSRQQASREKLERAAELLAADYGMDFMLDELETSAINLQRLCHRYGYRDLAARLADRVYEERFGKPRVYALRRSA